MVHIYHLQLQAKIMAKIKRDDRAETENTEPSEGSDPKKRKKGDKPPTDETCPPKATSFKGYDLSALPQEALPIFGHAYKGQHSYTVNIEGSVSWKQTYLVLFVISKFLILFLLFFIQLCLCDVQVF